ncbi:MAG: AI-2E family transporter, partial [Polyangiales bacterium]
MSDGSSWAYVRRVLLVALVAGAMFILWKVVDALLLVIAGILIAVFLHGLAGSAERYLGVSRRWAWTIVILGLVSLMGGLGAFLGAEIAGQLAELPALLPTSYDQVLSTLERYQWSAPLAGVLPESAEDLSSELDFAKLGGAAAALANAGVTLLLVFSVGVFLAASPRTYQRGFASLFPPAGRERI